ncbi:Na+/H+ antiporter NhaA [Stakelama pacifica]|uniref:Na(+)/H(+) antiporter NhaA n=1 Tax=Stakelama pacifica TaxID=517720 RepID=A0A4R6FMU3_9SPHN|nr:Na+/H+ antiporter NhaA [Stakelama pacifica]TDN82909.1 sodium/proton antiporter (NhaA family) [Stakelama pacifica]GGO95230.1 Na(+)/H(+) antiporter NhaA [Stakelama pacifica]
MQKTKAGSALRSFMSSEASGGIVLILASAAAMIVANIPGLSQGYFDFLHFETGPTFKPGHPMSIHLWINDGLMAIFFFLVGLEIKREFVDGRLATWERRRLPAVAAAAGMLVPALIYLGLTSSRPELQAGWAVPAATDIAFAIGVLALLGSRVPASMKLFLTTVAIVDDMGAVAIIALAYTDHLSTFALFLAVIVLGAMYTLNKSGVKRLSPYVILSVLLWYFVFLSGVHATIAGVLAALMIPITKSPGAPDSEESPLHKLEHRLEYWVAFFVVPVFGFANAGVSFLGLTPAILFDTLPLAIAAGLFFGKQIGILGIMWIADKTGFAQTPGGSTWAQAYGVSLLAGIGFTMSLFIGGLAFPGNELLIDEVKIGVLSGSILSAIVGFLVLRFAPAKRAD